MKPEVSLGSLTLSENVFGSHLVEGGVHFLDDAMKQTISKLSGPMSKPVISLSLSSGASTCSINRVSENDHNVVAIGILPQVKNKHAHGFRKDWESLSSSDMISRREPLKYNDEEYKETHQSLAEESKDDTCDASDFSNANSIISGSDHNSISRKRKNCSFNEFVDVISIPNRNEYSKRIRAKLWSTAVELHLNASRNTIEFAADGWDWRAATEEDKMTKCPKTGETIHPIHLCMNTQNCATGIGSTPSEEIITTQKDISQISSDIPSEV
jgi:hypothetical protein